MSVIIRDQNACFGVLGAHTTKQQKFTKNDINFLQAVANVLAVAIEHKQATQVLQQEKEKQE